MTLIELAKALAYNQQITVYDWANRIEGETLSVGYDYENSADLFIACVCSEKVNWTVSAVVPLDDCLVINCNM